MRSLRDWLASRENEASCIWWRQLPACDWASCGKSSAGTFGSKTPHLRSWRGPQRQRTGRKLRCRLHRDVAVQLRAFLAGRELEADEKVFEPLLRLRGQFKSDLRAAGISPKNAEGRVVDFHSLRHTFCTNLQRLNVPLRLIMLMMRHSDRRLSDQTYTDTSLLPADETVQMLTVPSGHPSHDLSHIASHDLVPASQNGSQAVTITKMPNGAETRMNTRDCHKLALAVTPGQKMGMVRDAGFEPATPTVSR